MDKSITNNVARADGLFTVQDKIGNLGLSTIKTVIKQAPEAGNVSMRIAKGPTMCTQK